MKNIKVVPLYYVRYFEPLVKEELSLFVDGETLNKWEREGKKIFKKRKRGFIIANRKANFNAIAYQIFEWHYT